MIKLKVKYVIVREGTKPIITYVSDNLTDIENKFEASLEHEIGALSIYSVEENKIIVNIGRAGFSDYQGEYYYKKIKNFLQEKIKNSDARNNATDF